MLSRGREEKVGSGIIYWDMNDTGHNMLARTLEISANIFGF